MRHHRSAEEIRIVPEGLRGEQSIVEKRRQVYRGAPVSAFSR
jgi:hypothetical protein